MAGTHQNGRFGADGGAELSQLLALRPVGWREEEVDDMSSDYRKATVSSNH